MEILREIDAYRNRRRYLVRYADLDTYNHVNNKAYFAWIEDARVRYLTEMRSGDVMIVRAELDYLSSIEEFEEVAILTRCSRIGGRSFTLDHLLYAGPEGFVLDDTARLCATARGIISSVDLRTRGSRENKPSFVARLREYEPVAPITGRAPRV